MRTPSTMTSERPTPPFGSRPNAPCRRMIFFSKGGSSMAKVPARPTTDLGRRRISAGGTTSPAGSSAKATPPLIRTRSGRSNTSIKRDVGLGYKILKGPRQNRRRRRQHNRAGVGRRRRGTRDRLLWKRFPGLHLQDQRALHAIGKRFSAQNIRRSAAGTVSYQIRMWH